jgi:GGDEF domain-containing protein
VADAPVEALLARVEGLAKGWLLALLERAPLDDMPAILAADLARDGPRVCDAVVRALADDADLRRLEAGGALEQLAGRVGELSGAHGIEATALAVDALQGVIWGGIREALANPDPDQVAELAERLALVTELVRSAALRRGADRPPVTAAQEGEVHDPGVTTRVMSPPPADEEPVIPPDVKAMRTRILRPLESETVPADATQVDRQALWVGAFEEELERCERAGAQVALLLVGLEDADRVLAVEAPREASAMFGRFAQAVRDAVRRHDVLACESETRAWVIARDTGRAGAQALAGRIAAMVRATPEWRGAPLSVTVGVAVLGEDGRDSESLIEAAEEARFAAAASGVTVLIDSTPPRSSA